MLPWEERRAGPFRIIAVPAVDGFGDPQRCWVVECEGTRILHAGDTLFHGHWWAIARAVGPIDVAFLPINGPTLQIPHVQPPSPFQQSYQRLLRLRDRSEERAQGLSNAKGSNLPSAEPSLLKRETGINGGTHEVGSRPFMPASRYS